MLRHCTINELLDVRDGDGTAAARAHLEVCSECRAELDRLHQRVAALRALPAFRAPRDRWPVVREAALAARRQAQWRRVRWVGLAAAAVVVGVVSVRAVRLVRPHDAAAREVQALVQESQQLENVLHTYRRDGRVVDGVTASAIADLEDRIATVDVGIEHARNQSVGPEGLADLWRERVTLMNQLVTTQVRQVAYVGF
jgi:predicted anti-sigma-YlaC factor YlaD